MLKNVICCFLVCVVILSVVYFCCTGEVEHNLFVSATVEEIEISEGSADDPIISDDEQEISNFMRISGLSKEETVDIVNNPEEYLYIVYWVNIENKGDTELLLKAPSNNMFDKKDAWLLNQIDGYKEILPNKAVKTAAFLVAKNTAENKNFSASLPMTVEYNEKIVFKKVRNSIIVWTQEDQ